jgi:hypothetical protein
MRPVLVLVSEDGWFIALAHSISVDPVTHQVYFPLQDVNGGPVLRIMKPAADQ